MTPTQTTSVVCVCIKQPRRQDEPLYHSTSQRPQVGGIFSNLHNRTKMRTAPMFPFSLPWQGNLRKYHGQKNKSVCISFVYILVWFFNQWSKAVWVPQNRSKAKLYLTQYSRQSKLWSNLPPLAQVHQPAIILESIQRLFRSGDLSKKIANTFKIQKSVFLCLTELTRKNRVQVYQW